MARILLGRPLREEFDPARNSLAMTRLGLATLVAITHGQINGFGWQTKVGNTELSELAVDGFFVVSGLLVARSYLTLGSLPRYAWHRFLRIMPGFWICLLVTAFAFAPIAALVEHGSASLAFDGNGSALTYVPHNAALLMRQYGISGLLITVPNPGVFDGSLWTLVYEAMCYALLGVLGVTQILRRRPWVLLAATFGLWLAVAAIETGAVTVHSNTLQSGVRFAFLFGLGALAWRYADRVHISGGVLAVAAGLLALGLFTQSGYRAIGGVGLAYVLVWIAVRAPWRWTPRTDLSYGMYVYHWPVQQLLVLGGLTAAGILPFIAVSLVASGICALASWHFVESRALAQKNANWVRMFERRQTADPATGGRHRAPGHDPTGEQERHRPISAR